MKEKNLSSSLKMIAIGMLITVAHFKFNGFDILIDWVGYLLIFLGLTPIIKDSKHSAIIKALGIVATAWSLIQWVCGFLSINLNNIVLTVIFTAVYVAYFFLFLTAVAFCTKDENRQNRIRLSAIINTVLHLVTSVISFIPMLQMVTLISGFANLAVRIWICVELFLLAKAVKNEEENEELMPQPDSNFQPDENGFSMPLQYDNQPLSEDNIEPKN